MNPRNVVILGSTGSVGTSTLEVIRTHRSKYRIVGLVGGQNIERLAEQVREFQPLKVSTHSQEGSQKLAALLGPTFKGKISYGAKGAEEIAASPEAEIVVAAIVGAAGLRPTFAAAKAGKTIALANKESMVVAGALVSQVVREAKAKLLPVDSEHSAIFQALAGAPSDQVRRLLLTASGGPFFRQPERDLSTVTTEEALAHPNWKMGSKITIDSATMMNKGLEIIEARWLFGFPVEKIDVVIHPQSIVHSMVEYIDGSVLAQLGVPDMKGPIAYALAYPDRLDGVMSPLNFSKMRELNFFEPDHSRFPSINLARHAVSLGETYPAALNGANEVSVDLFLKGKIRFTDIPKINEAVLSSYKQKTHGDLNDYLEADAWGRHRALEIRC